MQKKITVTNPATEEVLAELDCDDEAAIARKYESAKQAQPAWQAHSLAERIAAIARFMQALERERDALVRTLTLEVGKPLQEAKNEISGAVARTRFFVENAAKWLSPQDVHDAAGTREVLAFEPLGIVGNISAWNYPYLVGVNVFVPALIAGNAVLYKPSEFALLSGKEIARLLHASGVPEHIFQMIIGDGQVGKVLTELPLDGYFFTGSHRTGEAIAKALAGRLVPLCLELGGKDPLYVADDVDDIAKVAASAAEGSFYNSGQSCCAVERIYVHERVYDPFVVAFVAEVKRLRVGDPLSPETTIGAITRPAHLELLGAQVKDAIDHGAKLLSGGKRVGSKGSFFAPTVLTDVDHRMRVMKEETFGPIIGIQRVKDDAEATALMADTDYGLTASVYAKDEKRARAILDHLDVGTGYWNCCDRVSPYLPWSGRRHSGLGSTLSYLGILAFARPKGYHLRKG